MAIPSYQGYIASSQVNRAYGELSFYKTGVEEQLGKGVTIISNADLGYVPSSITTGNAAADIVVMNADSSGHLQVTLGGNASPQVSGAVIRLERTSAGVWSCVLDTTAAPSWRDMHRPLSCAP
ncbi:pilin [Marinobacter sp.]